MSKELKGIVLEIGGDTTKLGKALDSVNSQSLKLQKELSGVNTLLKLDPKNIELLRQKQELLNSSIEGTKEKLNMLKSTQAQVQKQFNNGEITVAQYRDFQREIISTENKFKSLTNEVKSFINSSSKIHQVGTKIKDIGNSTINIGKTLLPISAGIIAIGATAISSMNSVDEGLDIIAKKTGATGDASNELKEIYKQIANEVPGDFEDIGSVVGELNTRLDFTGDKLKNASIDFLKFAKINDIDVNTSVQLVTRTMGDASIEADSYKYVLEMLTVASQKSGISIDVLATNLAKYGAPMRALGIDTQEAIAMFAGWEKAGVSIEIAFSGIKKAISNWGAAGKDSTEEFKKSLDVIKKCPDIASATSKSIEIFGAKAGPDLADAIRGGRFEFETYIQALKNSSGVVDNTYGEIVDSVDDAQIASQNFKLSMHDLGETIAKMIGPILRFLSEKLGDLMDGFNGLNSETKQTIVTVLGIVAVVAPIIMIIGIMITGIGTLITSIGIIKGVIAGLTIAQNGLNLSFLACPITWIVLAIVGLIATFILLWNNCEEFRNFWIGLWENIKLVLLIVIISIQNAFNNLVNFIGGIVFNIFTFFQNLWYSIVNIFTTIGVVIGNAIGNAFQNVVNSIIIFAENTINGFIRSLNKAISLINNIPGVNINPLREFNIPKLKTGKANIPYDNYLALLHKGERVLTSKENRKYNKNKEENNINIIESKGNKDQPNYTFNLITDGKTIASTTAPYSDLISGERLKLTERGVLT